MTPTKPWEKEFDKRFSPSKLVNGFEAAGTDYDTYLLRDELKAFIASVESRARENAIRECAEVARKEAQKYKDGWERFGAHNALLAFASSILNLNNTK